MKDNFDMFMARVRAAKERPVEERTKAQIKLLNSLEIGVGRRFLKKSSMRKQND